MPIIDKPTIHFIVEELVASGIKDIIIVTKYGNSALEDYFDSNLEVEAMLEKAGKSEEAEKLRRLKALQSMQDEYTLQKNKQLEGSTQEILAEATSKNSESDMMGRTRSWKIVNFKGNHALAGKLVEAKITRAYLHSLRGEIN